MKIYIVKFLFPLGIFSREPAESFLIPIMILNKSELDKKIIGVEFYKEDSSLILKKKIDEIIKGANIKFSDDEIRDKIGIVLPDKEIIEKAKNLLNESKILEKGDERNKKVESSWYLLTMNYKEKEVEDKERKTILPYIKGLTYEITLKDLNIKPTPPDFINIKIKITFLNPDNSFTSIEKETTLFYLTSLPSQYGWYPGDGHMHTTWSDGDYSISERKNQAYNYGLKWIIITDHAGNDSDTLQENEWNLYNYICNTVQDSSVTVCPGEELHTKDYDPLNPLDRPSHLLTYKNSSYVSSYGTCQELINRVINNNGIPIIAHPYHILYPWNDWNATGFNGLEIISGQDGYSTQAINRWDTILTTNLQNIISGSYPKVIGVANRDTHSIGYFGINMNYIYTGSQSPPGTNRNQVYNNLIAGRVTASSDGSLAVFSLNGYAPGSIVNVTPRDNNITIVVNGESIYGYNTYYCEIKVIKNETQILQDGFYNSKIENKTYTFTARSDCYYRVEVIFYTLLNDLYIYSYCFVSPIYVNIQ